jgi:hypothetical protein
LEGTKGRKRVIQNSCELTAIGEGQEARRKRPMSQPVTDRNHAKAQKEEDDQKAALVKVSDSIDKFNA